MSGFIASSNKGRCLKSQTVSPQQGRRRIPSASYPVQSCLWHSIMALCKLAWGQEGVGMLVVAHSSQGQPGCRRRDGTRGGSRSGMSLWSLQPHSHCSWMGAGRCQDLRKSTTGLSEGTFPGHQSPRWREAVRWPLWVLLWFSLLYRGLSTYGSGHESPEGPESKRNTVSYIPHPTSPWSTSIQWSGLHTGSLSLISHYSEDSVGIGGIWVHPRPRTLITPTGHSWRTADLSL